MFVVNATVTEMRWSALTSGRRNSYSGCRPGNRPHRRCPEGRAGRQRQRWAHRVPARSQEARMPGEPSIRPEDVLQDLLPVVRNAGGPGVCGSYHLGHKVHPTQVRLASEDIGTVAGCSGPRRASSWRRSTVGRRSRSGATGRRPSSASSTSVGPIPLPAQTGRSAADGDDLGSSEGRREVRRRARHDRSPGELQAPERLGKVPRGPIVRRAPPGRAPPPSVVTSHSVRRSTPSRQEYVGGMRLGIGSGPPSAHVEGELVPGVAAQRASRAPAHRGQLDVRDPLRITPDHVAGLAGERPGRRAGRG